MPTANELHTVCGKAVAVAQVAAPASVTVQACRCSAPRPSLHKGRHRHSACRARAAWADWINNCRSHRGH